MLQRGVVRVTGQVIGTPDDAAKTLDLFKAGEPKVARATFVYGLAKALYDVSALYGGTKLDQPARMKLTCQQALDALGTIPETKETKALKGKIEGALKKIRAT